MLRNGRPFISRLFLIMFLFLAECCDSKADKIIPAYNNYKFETKVIEKLPIYDSLAFAILENMKLFQDSINVNDAYQAFRYMPTPDEPEVYKKLPDEISDSINRFISKIGKDFIYGFDIFRDSTIKIYVRRKTIERTTVKIEENLSYYPVGSNIKHREYPIKDTMLNIRWQYWTRFDTPDFF